MKLTQRCHCTRSTFILTESLSLDTLVALGLLINWEQSSLQPSRVKFLLVEAWLSMEALACRMPMIELMATALMETSTPPQTSLTTQSTFSLVNLTLLFLQRTKWHKKLSMITIMPTQNSSLQVPQIWDILLSKILSTMVWLILMLILTLLKLP